MILLSHLSHRIMMILFACPYGKHSWDALRSFRPALGCGWSFPQRVFISRIFFPLFNCSWIYPSMRCCFFNCFAQLNAFGEDESQALRSQVAVGFWREASPSKWENGRPGKCGVALSSGTRGFFKWLSLNFFCTDLKNRIF